MDLLDELKKIGGCTDYARSKNYYYEYHSCPDTGNNEKVMLDFTLKSDLTDDILRFGICPKCGLCIYHRDFNTKDF